MKTYTLVLFLFLCIAQSIRGQSFSDDNFVYTITPKKAVQSANLSTLTKEQINQNITYFDGLGRPLQTIAINQGGAGQDIITPMEYDSFGRQEKEYLPYALSNGGNNYPRVDYYTAINAAISYYGTDKYDNTANPFSQKQLESSPLNRVRKQAAPGTSWAMGSGHEIKLEYQTNTGDEVKLYQATAVWDSGLGLYEIAFSDQGNYTEKQLYKNITFDENTGANPSESGGSTVEFKNKEGQIILKRTYESGSKHDTYYVYDNYGNLTYVIPPKADGAINDEVLSGLCYQYKYDYRNRLVEKKLPGKQWEFIVYDKLDRPVATGPVFSPFKDDGSTGWIITKYDVFGRPIYTGWSSQAVSSVARNALQNAQNTAFRLFETKASQTIDGIATAYENAIAPTSFKLLTVNYYDDYTFPEAQAVPATIMTQPVLTNVKGLATGSWTRALTTASSIAGETATIFYDKKGRVISTYVKNHLTGTSHTDNEIDFAGKVLNTITEHQRVSGETKITVKEYFTYSVQDRLLTHTHQIGGGAEELLAENTYDELGQLTSKKVGNSTGNPLQKVDFNYNIRGWLTEINKTDELQQGSDPVDLFAFKINYNKRQTEIPNVKELYNGNISEIFWKTASDNLERSYGYQYDKLNRLTDAIYQKSKMTTESYNENLSYDKNGNIISLNRNGDMDPQAGTNVIDKLTYTYPANSNQLFNVVDDSFNSSGFNDANVTGDDYVYDVNGNLIIDKNKNITDIKYNYLNLPKKIIFGTGNTIEYIYNAAGQKLEKIVTENNVSVTTNYLGGFQYKDNVLEFFPTAEGYVKNDAGALSYVFQYKDHLGNIRLSFAKNPATQVLEITEENNYYPFGLKHKGYNNYVAINNKYKYQGQELQDELGLNLYTFKWRSYDPTLGRFISIDPIAEKYPHNATYAFAENRVVESIDLEGKESWFTQDGHLVTKAGPYTSQARQQLNLYSPSEVQQAKAKVASNSGPMLSQDKMSPTERKDHEIAVKAAIAEREAATQTVNNHENLGSPFTQLNVMKGVANGMVDMATGEIAGQAFKGLKSLSKVTKEGFDEVAFADEIVNLNKATDGGGALLNGDPASAINTAMYYETTAEQGASLFRSISHGHMFMNGNKRTAVSVFQSFARKQGLKTITEKQMLDVATQVAEGKITDVSEIAKLLTK